jgi:hypothetical protein
MLSNLSDGAVIVIVIVIVALQMRRALKAALQYSAIGFDRP